MERLTDCAQGYCEVYCDRYTSCFSEPDACERKYEVQLYERLKDYEGTGLEPQKIEQMKARLPLHNWAQETPDKLSIFGATVAHIQELLKAEHDGKLLLLPCKPGEKVYFLLFGNIFEKTVFSIVTFSGSARFYCAGTSEYFRPEDIDKTVFLTREAAEAALEAGKN